MYKCDVVRVVLVSHKDTGTTYLEKASKVSDLLYLWLKKSSHTSDCCGNWKLPKFGEYYFIDGEDADSCKERILFQHGFEDVGVVRVTPIEDTTPNPNCRQAEFWVSLSEGVCIHDLTTHEGRLFHGWGINRRKEINIDSLMSYVETRHELYSKLYDRLSSIMEYTDHNFYKSK
jgi:hypothetical protein